MFTATIKDIWLGNLPVRGYPLYLVRDGTTVFYVGRSSDPASRLRGGHLNPSERSKLGILIKQHLPLSLDWTLELFEIAECGAIVAQWQPNEYQRFQTYRDDERYCWVSRDIAERAMIACYHPCFNVQGNPSPTPLPEQYQRPGQPEAGAKSIEQWIKELFGGQS